MRVLIIWLSAAVVTAAFVAATSVGPVVFTLGQRHGAHLSDLVVAAAAALVATWLTVWPRPAPDRRTPG